MVNTNIDIILRQWLLIRNLPIHFYSEGLFHAVSCLRELTFDTLNIINVANLPIDDTGNVMLPDDFQDDISVSIPNAGALIPLPKQDWITPIRTHDTTSGAFVAPNDANNSTSVNTIFGFPNSWDFYWNVDDYSNFTGRQFGSHGGTRRGYKIFKEQRRMQLTDTASGDSIVLLYISNGLSADNASQVDTFATRTIQTYIDWQSSPNKTSKDSYEARTYYNEKRRLKTLLNQISVTDLKNIYRNSYTATIKT